MRNGPVNKRLGIRHLPRILGCTVRQVNAVDCNLTYWYTISMVRMGRPPKPLSKVRSHVVPIRFTNAQWRELQKRAKENGIPVSEYIRRKLELRSEDE